MQLLRYSVITRSYLAVAVGDIHGSAVPFVVWQEMGERWDVAGMFGVIKQINHRNMHEYNRQSKGPSVIDYIHMYKCMWD